MAVNSSDEENIAGRLERLPYSAFHTKFALMLASGEWAESLMLLGNGAILTLVAAFYGLTGDLSAYAVPAFFFAGEFIGSILFGRIADTRGRRAVFLTNQLVFGIGMIIAGFMNSWQLIGTFVLIGGIGVGGEFPLVDSYGTEMFVRKKRGAWLALIYTIAVTAAPLIVYITSITKGIGPLGGLVGHEVGYYSFRIPLWFMGTAGILVWLIRFRLKESPRWLATHGKMDQAKKMMDVESGSIPIFPILARDGREIFNFVSLSDRSSGKLQEFLEKRNHTEDFFYNRVRGNEFVSGVPKKWGILTSMNLTPTERTLIKTAYKHGFFEWPRTYDLELMRKDYNLSKPTLLYHLRNAERKIMKTIFD